MTTVAWDGKLMAADTLATDSWGLKHYASDKIAVHCPPRGEYVLIGMAGEKGHLAKWIRSIDGMTIDEIVARGYPDHHTDTNDPAIMLVTRVGSDIKLYIHVNGAFLTGITREFHAIGSGRDYALAAMHLGKCAIGAIKVAMEFDNGTGGEVVSRSFL